GRGRDGETSRGRLAAKTPGRAPRTYQWVVVGPPYFIVYEIDEVTEATTMHTSRAAAIAAILFAVLAVAPALAFDYDRYQPTDLDERLAQPRPRTGLDLNGGAAVRLEVKLISYEETCAVEAIAPTMRMQGFSQEMIDGAQASRCIKVRSAKGKETLLFVQDVV